MIIYEVHDEKQDNLVVQFFTGHGSKQRAIKAAKALEAGWVERVIYTESTDSYEYDGGVWDYKNNL